MSIEVLNESGEADVNEEMLIDVCSYALTAMDVHPEAEATITLVDEPTPWPTCMCAGWTSTARPTL